MALVAMSQKSISDYRNLPLRRATKSTRLFVFGLFVVLLFVYINFRNRAQTDTRYPEGDVASLAHPDRVLSGSEDAEGYSSDGSPSSDDMRSTSSDADDVPHSPSVISSDDRIDNVYSRIAKVTALYYDKVTQHTEAYESALLSHQEHNRNFGYRHFVLRHQGLGPWTKQAYMLQLLSAEMQKPVAERLAWLWWHDADLVLINSDIPLEIFLPPQHEYPDTNLIVANDLNGLNDGVYFIRVCEWSVHFMAAVLAFPSFYPDDELFWYEQSSMNLLVQNERWKNGTIHVPQRWFNAYHHFGIDDDIPLEWNWVNGYVEPGDLLVHLAGTYPDGRTELLHEWLDKLRNDRSTWVVPLTQTSYMEEIERFWAEDAKDDFANQIVYWRRYHVLRDVGDRHDEEKTAEIEQYEKSHRDESSEEEIEAGVEVIKMKHKKLKIDALRHMYRARESGTEKDNTIAA